MTTRSNIRWLVLTLGAAAVVLAGLLVPLHVAHAHHCPAHTPVDTDDCAVCLHWSHWAFDGATGVDLPDAGDASTSVLARVVAVGYDDSPTAPVRGPPALV